MPGEHGAGHLQLRPGPVPCYACLLQKCPDDARTLLCADPKTGYWCAVYSALLSCNGFGCVGSITGCNVAAYLCPDQTVARSACANGQKDLCDHENCMLACEDPAQGGCGGMKSCEPRETACKQACSLPPVEAASTRLLDCETNLCDAACTNELSETVVACGIPRVTGLSISPLSATIAVGSDQLFSATATFSDGTANDVTLRVPWSTNDFNASISDAGVAHGMNKGVTDVTATFNSYDDTGSYLSAKATLTVR